MTSAEFLDMLTLPIPPDRNWYWYYWYAAYNSPNFPYYVHFGLSPSPPKCGHHLSMTPRFTKQFRDLMSSMQSTEAGVKMYRIVSAKPYTRLYGYESGNCSQRLSHIILHKMNCRGLADKLEPQLLSVQIFMSMTANEKLWESIMMSKNCSQLSGGSLDLCEEALSGRIHTLRKYIKSNLKQEINNCYIEEKGNLRKYMSKR